MQHQDKIKFFQMRIYELEQKADRLQKRLKENDGKRFQGRAYLMKEISEDLRQVLRILFLNRRIIAEIEKIL